MQFSFIQISGCSLRADSWYTHCRSTLQWATRLLPFSKYLDAESEIYSIALSLIIELPPTVEVRNLRWSYFTQERPPAWTQETYRPQEGARCWPPPPPAGPDPPPRRSLTWPPPIAHWPDPPPLDLAPPISSLTWPPQLAGPDPPLHRLTDLTPPPCRLDLTPPPPSAHWPDPPPRCGQTNKVKLLPSRRTTYAGGNKT